MPQSAAISIVSAASALAVAAQVKAIGLDLEPDASSWSIADIASRGRTSTRSISSVTVAGPCWTSDSRMRRETSSRFSFRTEFRRRPTPRPERPRTGLTLPYSSGKVESHVNRIIKMIKRQMYGRADPDLLHKRTLLAAIADCWPVIAQDQGFLAD
jgi:hypothetical protein